jgi:hypothetical protein
VSGIAMKEKSLKEQRQVPVRRKKDQNNFHELQGLKIKVCNPDLAGICKTMSGWIL